MKKKKRKSHDVGILVLKEFNRKCLSLPKLNLKRWPTINTVFLQHFIALCYEHLRLLIWLA